LYFFISPEKGMERSNTSRVKWSKEEHQGNSGTESKRYYCTRWSKTLHDRGI